MSRHHTDRCRHVDTPYPDGESWRQAVDRVCGFLDDLPSRWGGCRVLVVGHVATRWALDHIIDGVALSELCGADTKWQEGWEYRLVRSPSPKARPRFTLRLVSVINDG